MALGSKTYQKKILSIRIMLLVVGVLIILMLISIFDRFMIEREMAARRLQAEAEYASLQIRQQELQERVEYLSKEGSVESEIRKHFDVAKEGEQVVIIVDEVSTSSAILPMSGSIEPNESPWYIFWR